MLCGVCEFTMYFGGEESGCVFGSFGLWVKLGFEEISGLTSVVRDYCFFSLHAIIRDLYKS